MSKLLDDAARYNLPEHQIATKKAFRHERDDPSDTNTRSSKPRQVTGYRRSDPCLLLHKRGDISDRHMKAIDRYRDDFEISQGARPGWERPEVGGGSQASGPAHAQLQAAEAYRRANAAVGKTTSRILVAITLCGQTLAEYAEDCGMSAHAVKGYLVAALDALRDHYEEIGDSRITETAR